MQKPQKLH